MKKKNIQSQLAKLKLRDRPSQLEMIEKSYQALKKNQIICVEAPTGTGKTLSYLIACLHAKTKKQKIILSTATIALQEQLMTQDLPLLEKLTNDKIRYSTAKGRQNYLCMLKLEQAAELDDLFQSSDDLDYLKSQVKSNFWNGDKEQLSKQVADKEWLKFTMDSSGCSGKRCEFYEDCFYYKARSKMHAADFIVTNHSLLLSDLELGSGVLLPEPENNLYVIDECHHLPERSLSHFSKSSVLIGSVEWINQINSAVQRAIKYKFIEQNIQKKINQCTQNLIEQIKQLKSQLDLNDDKFTENSWRITPSDKAQLDIAKHLLDSARELNQSCVQLEENITAKLELKSPEVDKEDFDELTKQHSQLKFLVSKVNHFFSTWELFYRTQQPKEPPVACWFEKIAHHEGREDYICHCSPINVSAELKTLLWDKVKNGALLCSATIRSLGNFDSFLRKAGLKQLNNVRTEVIPAIFNYTNSVIFAPSMQHEPSGIHQAAHRQEALDLLPELILPNSGTLVLFTSRKTMHEAFDLLPPTLTLDILMQGKQTKRDLLNRHKQRIDANNRSILFGLASFAEGIDLPAKYCEHVIIYKLPFAVPTSPVELTRSEWISKHKLNPFMLATLPETSIKLTQYVGRLIRQEDDLGIVTILDKRIYSKKYGKQLIDNLPPFQKLLNTTFENLKQQPIIDKLYSA